MTLAVKVSASVGIVAGAGVMLLEWLAALQAAPASLPTLQLGDGLLGGLVAAAVTWGLYKGKVDDHARRLKDLEDKSVRGDVFLTLQQQVGRIEQSVQRLTDHLLHGANGE